MSARRAPDVAGPGCRRPCSAGGDPSAGMRATPRPRTERGDVMKRLPVLRGYIETLMSSGICIHRTFDGAFKTFCTLTASFFIDTVGKQGAVVTVSRHPASLLNLPIGRH
ncbi:hypothetical protein J6590_003973 [Homalodisca vitripennis]|nr:hypothetical protein J6590_003973 [Homalodisca vitripennis]